MLFKQVLPFLVAGLLLSSAASAAEGDGIELEGIEVKSKQEQEQEQGFIERKTNETSTQSTVTKEGVRLLGGPAQTLSLKAVELIPSVHVESPDAYGLVSRFPHTFRSRGQLGIGLGYMFEGVPVWGISQPGPRVDMFDMENIRSTTYYKGAVPVDKGLGAMNTAGAIYQEVLRPTDDFGLTFKQSLGSSNFSRSFVRLDSGDLPTGTKIYGSYSYTTADKWRGEGGAPDYRHHVSLGAVQDLSSSVKLELFGDYHDNKLNNFRTLTFAQANDLDQYRDYDYNPTLTGTQTEDRNYFDYNRETAKNLNVLAKLEVALSPESHLSFRPYYWTEERRTWAGGSFPGASPNAAVTAHINDFARYGAVLEYKTSVSDADVLLGYWIESLDLFMSDKTYRLAPGTGALVFDANAWRLGKNDGNGQINSPYVRVNKDFGNITVDAGLRYFHLFEPAKNGYVNNSGIPDVDFEEAFDYDPAIDPGASYRSSTKDLWVPNIGLSYAVSDRATVYANAGKNYARPRAYPGLISSYIQNRTAFQNAGVTLQHLVDRFKLERTNNFDIGMRYNGDTFYAQPSAYYVEGYDKLMSVYDPVLGFSTMLGAGETTVYGAELELGVNPIDDLSGFFSFTYTHSRIDNDVQTALGTFMPTAGKRVPDTPEFMAKLGASYRIKSIEIAPIIKFVGSRWADADNAERVPSYTVVDLNISYNRPELLGVKDFTAGLSFLNLFDNKYIGQIGSFDDTLGSAFYPGAPFTTAFTIGGKF